MTARPHLDAGVEDHFEHAPCGFVTTRPDGTFERVNSTFAAMVGSVREELVGRRRFVDLLAPGSRIYHETHYLPLLRMQGQVKEIALDLVGAGGLRVPVLVNSRLRTDAQGRPLTLTSVFDATDRKTYERELLQAKRRAEQSTARLRVLEEVVAELAGSAEVEQVCDVVTSAAVDAFGAAGSVVGLGDDAPAAAGLDPPAGGSVSVVPLTARGRPIGELAAAFGPGRVLDDEEVVVLRTLGRQAGVAIERAQLFEEQREVARTLQRSLLPERLPDDPRCRVATLYRPAVHALSVGGDWYDATAVDADRLALVVGDVVGRGLQAAGTMGQLRSAIRALAGVDAGPAGVLERLDRFVDDLPAARTATLAYAVLDLTDGRLDYACAGHPPPVLLPAGGPPRLLWGGRSAPVGARFGSGPRGQAGARLGPGDRLVLYTDGLVEVRDAPLDRRIETLAGELGRAARDSLNSSVEQAVDAMLASVETQDDVCVLAVERAPVLEGAR